MNGLVPQREHGRIEAWNEQWRRRCRRLPASQGRQRFQHRQWFEVWHSNRWSRRRQDGIGRRRPIADDHALMVPKVYLCLATVIWSRAIREGTHLRAHHLPGGGHGEQDR